ncbi:MAG: class F sortase [Nocardioides sp.]|nr:class F sortase [Nocardioides sp.]
MRLPDTARAARKVILAGGAVVLVVLAALLGTPRLRTEIENRQPVSAPVCVRDLPATPASPATPTPSATAEPTPRADPARGVPLAVEIPELGVTATVTRIDLGAGGVLQPPSDYTTVGWWSEGAQPGSREGTAVITGHAVHAGDGAFDDLARLGRGSLVRVRTERGVITYRVDAVEDYTKDQLARISDRVFSQTVEGQLVLVTCSDYYAGEYHGNTVVIAHPKPAR